MFNTILAILGLLSASALGTYLAFIFRRMLDAEGTPTSDIVDCDEVPSIPSGLTIAKEEHQVQSRVRGLVNPREVEFYSDQRQGQTSCLRGDLLKEALEGQPVMPANLLDWYLAHSGVIPESWKDQLVFFWGTIYADGGGRLYVRCLGWNGDHWCEDYRRLGRGWRAHSPALVSASRS